MKTPITRVILLFKSLYRHINTGLVLFYSFFYILLVSASCFLSAYSFLYAFSLLILFCIYGIIYSLTKTTKMVKSGLFCFLIFFQGTVSTTGSISGSTYVTLVSRVLLIMRSFRVLLLPFQDGYSQVAIEQMMIRPAISTYILWSLYST